MKVQKATTEKLKIYFCFSEKDTLYFEELEKHLRPLEKNGLIENWSRRSLKGGDNIDYSVNKKLQASDIIIILVSSDFFATDYLYNKEMHVAIKRHNSGQSVLVPVYVRSCDLESSILNEFIVLPDNKTPIESRIWNSKDQPYAEIVKSLKEVFYEALNKKNKNIAINNNNKTIFGRIQSTNTKDKENYEEILRNIYVEQIILSPFDCTICLYPAIGTRTEPNSIFWNVEPCTDFPKLSDTYNPSYHRPLLSLLAEGREEFCTLYINHNGKIENSIQHGVSLKRGDKICTVSIPLLVILDNLTSNPYWNFAKGESTFGNVLSYQPDLRYWNTDFKVRLVLLNSSFGCLKVTSPYEGSIFFSKKYQVGDKIEIGDVIARVVGKSGTFNLPSSVAGTISSTPIKNGDQINANSIVASIRTFPLLLLLEIEPEFFSEGDSFYCLLKAPIHGNILKKEIHLKNRVELLKGNELFIENSVICTIRTNNILIGLFVTEFTGIVADDYTQSGSQVLFGQPLYKLRPKFAIIRSPMLGKFYRSSDPHHPPYVNVGDKICRGQILCIIEAMKLNNEIECEVTGTIVSILAEDSYGIEYNQPIFKVQLYE